MRPLDKHIPGLFDNTESSSAPADDSASFNTNAGFGDGGDPAAGGVGFSSPSVIEDDGTIGRRPSHPTPNPYVPTVPTTPVTLPTVPASPTPFTINIEWDSTVAFAPSGFASDIIAAVNFLETQFTDPVTMNIAVGYGEVAGNTLGGGDLGESLSNLSPVSYASLLSAVTANATTATDASVVASLPATSPINGASWWVTTAQAKALGLASANGTQLDGSVGFAASSQFTYGDTNTSGTVAAGTYDFFATAQHEITEVMGRQMLNGTAVNGTRNSDTLLDLLHYSAPGTRGLSASSAGYLSVDGGTTNLGAFNTNSGGDSGDWASSVTDNSFDAFATPGVLEPVSANDLTAMDALGWDPGGTTPIVIPVVPVTPGVSGPTGVSFAPEAQYLAIAQGCGGLAAGIPLAAVSEVGGTAGDKFKYTISGTGAADFTLIPANGGAILAVGPRVVGGTSGGQLFALTVTATDETAAGNPSASDPVNIIFGDNGNDTITPASMAGVVASAPTFIYGLSGNDTIDGTGMTGTLYFDGGTGTDTMTGGSGPNVYEFGAGAAASTGSAQDIITNFKAAVDLIDLTWVGWRFSDVAALDPTATTIAADSVGWQTSGGNTLVYANTSNRTEALTATNMKIELQGNIALTSANFGHL